MVSKQAAASVSVIIPAFNAEESLGACLDALAAQGVPGQGRELIVVDDRSTDRTSQVASRPGVTVLTGPGTGPAGARNVGARAAGGDVLIFLDADTVPQPHWLDGMVAPLRDPVVVAVKGRYCTDQRSVLARFAQLEFEWKYARLERATHVDFVDTGTASYRREAFLKAGGFDEGFRASEDVDLAFRLASQGAQFAFNPRAVVLHHHTADVTGYFKKKVRAAFTRTQVYERYPQKAMGDSYTPPAMGLQIGLTGLLLGVWVLRVAGLGRWVRWPQRLGQFIFLLSTLPLVKRAWDCDTSLVPYVPALVFFRALAQGVGVAGALTLRIAHRIGV